jgi:hypothetical protein
MCGLFVPQKKMVDFPRSYNLCAVKSAGGGYGMNKTNSNAIAAAIP